MERNPATPQLGIVHWRPVYTMSKEQPQFPKAWLASLRDWPNCFLKVNLVIIKGKTFLTDFINDSQNLGPLYNARIS
jgi:hypothetical protein